MITKIFGWFNPKNTDERIEVEKTPSPYEDVEVISQSNYNDVYKFHEKFGLPVNPRAITDENGEYMYDDWSAKMLDQDLFDFRYGFMKEELEEFESSFKNNDIAGMADALIDLVYVAMGTAHFMNLPWDVLWDDVQRANMAKVRAESGNDLRSKRKNSLDVVKPEGWEGPKTREILTAFGALIPEIEEPVLKKEEKKPSRKKTEKAKEKVKAPRKKKASASKAKKPTME